MWWRSVIWTGILLGAFVWLIPHILWLVSWLIGKAFSCRVPYAPFAWFTLVVLLVVWGSLAYGHYFGRFCVEVNKIEYRSKEVPKSFDGYKILHISDLHVDSFEATADLQRIIDKVNGQNADVILFTGDMTTGSMEGIKVHEHTLKQLKAQDGVMSVLGNHDFFIYDRQYRSFSERCVAADRLTDYEKDILGWKVLRNQSFKIKKGCDSIAIAGVDNINGGQGFRTIQKGDLQKAITGLEGVFTILMTHDPSHWSAEVLPQSQIQITLSGHTHTAQVRLFGYSLANLAFKECDGRYDRDSRMLYVNAGIGCTAPFRIGCPSEITVITLKHIDK